MPQLPVSCHGTGTYWKSSHFYPSLLLLTVAPLQVISRVQMVGCVLANLPPEVILTRVRDAGHLNDVSMAVYCGCTRLQPPKKSRLFPRHGPPAMRAKMKALSMIKFIAANIPNIPFRNIETNARRKPQHRSTQSVYALARALFHQNLKGFLIKARMCLSGEVMEKFKGWSSQNTSICQKVCKVSAAHLNKADLEKLKPDVQPGVEVKGESVAKTDVSAHPESSWDTSAHIAFLAPGKDIRLNNQTKEVKLVLRGGIKLLKTVLVIEDPYPPILSHSGLSQPYMLAATKNVPEAVHIKGRLAAMLSDIIEILS
ncbi:hypothetical protein DFH08DRAFT_816886 [Mycena albidolilacea]|uniref:Uncharacterized protein n=1 Tax=Mycena albidolilacea TaxID=1033008 RepID=A0AAD7EJ09_9AGAR|nr:hypothetical protein DFH08DRAFT_816886 [Mycena albidolilacea]